MVETKRKLGVGKVADAELVKGASDEEALAVVLKHFPDAKTTIGSIRWYRSELRSEGNRYDVPTSAEARRKPNLRLVA